MRRRECDANDIVHVGYNNNNNNNNNIGIVFDLENTKIITIAFCTLT